MDNLDELTATLERTFSQKSSEYWLDALEAAGVPSGPIYDIEQVYRDPQVRAREMVVETDHPVAGRTSNIGIPIKLSRDAGAVPEAGANPGTAYRRSTERAGTVRWGDRCAKVRGERRLAADILAISHDSLRLTTLSRGYRIP